MPNASVSAPMFVQHERDEVGRRHLGVAGHVPRGAPAQRAGQRVVERREAVDDGGERALVEADLGVGEVAVVEQQQVGLPLADELLDAVSSPSMSISIGAARTRRPSHVVVQADADAVAAQRRVVAGGGLPDAERRVGAVGGELESGARVLTPLVCSHSLAQASSSRPDAFSSAVSRSTNSEFA